MTSTTTVLEDALDQEGNELDAHQLASTGQRFLNYLLDIIFLVIFFFVALVIISLVGMDIEQLSENEATFMFYGLWLLYYFVMERLLGKTIGKMITGTGVSMNSGGAITSYAVFIRTISRLVPFEAFSAFMGDGMWHDRWAKTRVVKTR
jgi:uncharacterized RDD family membrane protein YckC